MLDNHIRRTIIDNFYERYYQGWRDEHFNLKKIAAKYKCSIREIEELQEIGKNRVLVDCIDRWKQARAEFCHALDIPTKDIPLPYPSIEQIEELQIEAGTFYAIISRHVPDPDKKSRKTEPSKSDKTLLDGIF